MSGNGPEPIIVEYRGGPLDGGTAVVDGRTLDIVTSSDIDISVLVRNVDYVFDSDRRLMRFKGWSDG